MSKPEQKQVIVELQNGDKCEGVLANIDKVNLKIQLTAAKKTSGTAPTKVESFETLEISKADIKEIKVIQFEAKTEPKEESGNINAIPDNKKPLNVEQTKQKSYDKNESFFDTLSGATHFEARQESKNYNQKNKDTFNLPNEPERKPYYNNRGRGGYHHNRGRGGYYNNNRGRGGYNNYNNYHNNNNGNYNGRRGIGRGRGGYNNYHRGGYQQFNNQHMNGNKLTPYQPEGGIQPGMEKSIYDN